MKGNNKLTEMFYVEGHTTNINTHCCGHINDTYFATVLNGEKEEKYVVQKINTDIFKDPKALMKNIEKVTSHISNKVKSFGGDPLRESLNVIKARSGKSYYKDKNGDYWRVFSFIEGAKTYMMVQKPEDFYTCGKAIGKFQMQLSDFDANELYETIPDFHNTQKRFDAFKEAVRNDIVGRVSQIQSEIDFLFTREAEMGKIVRLLDEKKIPLRVTHNDTKYNNIMIDNITGEGVCVIDLDTVMPGTVLYDFGDAIRSGATTAEEDEVDLTKVNFDMELFELFTKGYLESVGKYLTSLEIDLLPFSCKLITMELAMRFLTDYLNGDTYFKIQRPNHNLERARNQLKLVCDMEENLEDMKKIVDMYKNI